MAAMGLGGAGRWRVDSYLTGGWILGLAQRLALVLGTTGRVITQHYG